LNAIDSAGWIIDFQPDGGDACGRRVQRPMVRCCQPDPRRRTRRGAATRWRNRGQSRLAPISPMVP